MFKPLLCALMIMGASVVSAASVNSQMCDSSIKNNTPVEDFTIHKNGTVSHKTDGLMWSTCSLGQTFENGSCKGDAKKFNWHDAMKVAKDSRLAGYDNWRLPTIDELDSIVEIGCHNPSINLSVFPNTDNGGYWSSSTIRRLKSNARAMFFFYGEDSNFYKRNPYNVRLVRDAN